MSNIHAAAAVLSEASANGRKFGDKNFFFPGDLLERPEARLNPPDPAIDDRLKVAIERLENGRA